MIVADDGGDSTCEALIRQHFPWAKRMQGPQKGPAANRNRGAKAAQAPWIVFCDDDCLPAPEFLAAYLRAIEAQPETKVFEGKIVADRPRRHPLEGAPINENGGQLWSCNLAVARNYFFEIGGFNEKFPYAAMEDLDFRRRVIDSGALAILLCRTPSSFSPLANAERQRAYPATRRFAALIYARLHPEDRGLFTFGMHLRN